ncbi:PAS domain-containing protein, partial [Acinetobacter baumannii]
IERVNPATLELTGFSPDELLGSDIDVLVRNPRLFHRIFSQTLGSRRLANRLELFCKRKDGTHFPVSVSMSTIYDPENGCHKLVCVARDIT